MKSSLGAGLVAGPLLLCGVADAPAAVMDFPDAAPSSSSWIGLEQADDGAAGSLTPDGDEAAGYDSGELDLLPRIEAPASTDSIVDSVLGVSRSGNWLEETRNLENSQPTTAFDLMRAYVNVVNSSHSRPPQGNGTARTQSGGGKGFVMSLAEGIDDRETLDLITRVMQPHVEDDMVVFSVLGFGQFMIIGEPEAGNLSVMDIASGRRTDLRRNNTDNLLKRNSASAASPPSSSSATFMPHQEENLAEILLMILAIVSNPMFLLTSVCVLGVWCLYRLAKRFG